MVTDKYKKKLVEQGNKAIENKEWKKSIKIFSELSEIFIDHYEVLSNLSMSLINNKEYEKSHKILDKLEKISPLDVQVNFMRGCCYELQKKYDASLESFKKCLRIDKDHQDSWEKCALILVLKGDLLEAISVYKKILKDTKSLDIAIKLAVTLAANSQKKEAIEILEGILKSSPDNETAKNLLKKIN
tara:strand:+ start:439 stop:999 length:561 start_codon:yes stop_codon:yes gene_type:complete